MYRRCLPDWASQSATPCVWAIVIGGSISTASSEPKMSVDVMGDETRASPEGSDPLARTTPSETRVSYERRVVMLGSFSLERRSSRDAPHPRSERSKKEPARRAEVTSTVAIWERRRDKGLVDGTRVPGPGFAWSSRAQFHLQ